MGNKYFGQQHSHSRDIPHHVRRCFVGISDPLLGSYFHGRILHRILFKSSWSPDTRYSTWSTCCSPAVPILTCTSQQRNSHNTSVVNLTIFKLVYGNARAKSCNVNVQFLFLARIVAVTASNHFCLLPAYL